MSEDLEGDAAQLSAVVSRWDDDKLTAETVLADPWHGEPSPRIDAIRRQYQRLGYFSWDNARVGSLASRLGITVRELCAMAGMFDTKSISVWKRRDHWPSVLAVNFADIERMANWKKLYARPTNPGPYGHH